MKENDAIAIVWAFIAGTAGIFVGDFHGLLGLVIYASLMSINYSVAAAAEAPKPKTLAERVEESDDDDRDPICGAKIANGIGHIVQYRRDACEDCGAIPRMIVMRDGRKYHRCDHAEGCSQWIGTEEHAIKPA